jgi:phospholipase D1/2
VFSGAFATVTPSKARWLLIVLAVVIAGAAALLWRFTPLQEIATPSRLAQWIGTFKDAPWSPLAVVAIYVLAGLIVFPLMLLVAATAVVFEPLLALAVSLIGALANAAVLYLIGAKFARGMVEHAFGPALQRASGALETRGILAVAAVRTVPIAPFTVVNLAAGSIGVRFTDYLIGTALGLLPGIIVLTAFGAQLRSIWRNPTPGKLAIVAAIVLCWIALSLLLQKITTRRRAHS